MEPSSKTPDKWDQRFLDLARHVAQWSKDPSTNVGCVIVNADKTIASIGYNGFPRGVIDDADRLHDRDTKLAMTLHAEDNAILSANQQLDGCIAYTWPMPPCSTCAARLIQAGVVRVVAPSPGSRWHESCLLGQTMMREAGVCSVWLDDEGER